MRTIKNKFIIAVFSLGIFISALEVVKAQSPCTTTNDCLITLWNHQRNIDPTNVVQELGFNLIWSHDRAYEGQAWEETHMYKMLQVPGVKYVFAKIERAAWGWTHEQSLKHARWVAQLSLEHPGILGMYLNDFYDEIEDGHRTEEQWREIIAAAKEINPNLQLWVPDYPHRNQGRHAFDFDIDGVIMNLWGNTPELMARAREHLTAGLEKHPDIPLIAGLYLRSGPDGGRWLSEDEFKSVLGFYVEMVNAGKFAGLRVFSAGQFEERPEYIGWAKEILSGLRCPRPHQNNPELNFQVSLTALKLNKSQREIPLRILVEKKRNGGDEHHSSFKFKQIVKNPSFFDHFKRGSENSIYIHLETTRI